MRTQKKYSIGIDLGGTNTKIGLVDCAGHILVKTSFSTKDFSCVSAWISQVKKVVWDLVKSTRITQKNIVGCGVGVPGLVHVEKGLIYRLTNMKGWENLALGRILKKTLDISVYVDNDVNAAALGEYVYGRNRAFQNMVFLTLGTGVGGGLILEGELFRGGSFSAGEIGHIVVDPKGPLCNCGQHGCLETCVGNSYLVARVVAQLKAGQKSCLTKMVAGNYRTITPYHIYQAACQKDAYALQVWRSVGAYIGKVLVGVVNLLNPDAIIIGGGMSGASQFFLGPVRTCVRRNALGISAKSVTIMSARLQENAGIIGAAALWQEMQKENCLNK